MLTRSRIVIPLLLTTIGATTMAATDDEAAILAVQSKQAAAWNAHDASAYAALFTNDGDVVNVLGWWWKSRDEIRSKLTDAFATAFRDSQLTISDVKVRKLSPDIAIAHVRWKMSGALTPPGAPAAPQQGIQLQVLIRGGDGWLITSFQNTNSLPERSFSQVHAPAH